MSSIYSVFLNDGDHYTMTGETVDKLQDWLDNNTDIYNECYVGDMHRAYIANNVTDLYILLVITLKLLDNW